LFLLRFFGGHFLLFLLSVCEPQTLTNYWLWSPSSSSATWLDFGGK
jgi:hypothetical protein